MNMDMDNESFKDFKTSRGINYHYYRVLSRENRPTLLFCHGFPSTAYDWRHQVAFFKQAGYGIVAPDMLGYGGTDRPTETDQYRFPLLVKDFDELLEHESLPQVVIIGHDWGCFFATHMMIRIPERFIGLVLLSIGYLPPERKFDAIALNRIMKEQLGFTVTGYQEFFLEDGASEIIAAHYDSFQSVVFPEDPMIWKEVMNPVGALKEFLLSDKIAPAASYITNEAREHMKSLLLKDNLRGGLQWYKSIGFAYEDSIDIPKSNYEIKQPTLFVGALKDSVSPVETMKQSTAKYAKNLKAIEFDTGHWIQLEKPAELNEEIQTWLTERVLDENTKEPNSKL